MAVYVTKEIPADLQEDALEALEVARDTGSVKKGTNETTKAPERADEKGIPVVFIETQDDVGHAAGLEVGSAAAAVVNAGEASTDVEDIAGKLEDL